MGLDQIFADMYSVGRAVTPETGEAIVEKLSTMNYIVPSVKSKYAILLLEEYDKYVQVMEKGRRACGPGAESAERKKGFPSRILKAK